MKQNQINELLKVADDLASEGYGIPAYRIARVLLQLTLDSVGDDPTTVFCRKYNGIPYLQLIKNYKNEFKTSLKESKEMVDELINYGRLKKVANEH